MQAAPWSLTSTKIDIEALIVKYEYLVTGGEFSNPAKTEARLSGKHVEMIDVSSFIEK